MTSTLAAEIVREAERARNRSNHAEFRSASAAAGGYLVPQDFGE